MHLWPSSSCVIWPTMIPWPSSPAPWSFSGWMRLTMQSRVSTRLSVHIARLLLHTCFLSAGRKDLHDLTKDGPAFRERLGLCSTGIAELSRPWRSIEMDLNEGDQVPGSSPEGRHLATLPGRMEIISRSVRRMPLVLSRKRRERQVPLPA